MRAFAACVRVSRSPFTKNTHSIRIRRNFKNTGFHSYSTWGGFGHLRHQTNTTMKNLSQFSDQELISKIIAGKADATGELYIRYYKKVFQKCISMVKDPDEAFDLAQDTLIKTLNSLKTFRGDSAFSTWLYIIAHRQCLEYLRKKGKQNFQPVTLEQEERLLATDDALDDMEGSSIEKTMLMLVESMPEADKNLLILKYRNGLPIEALREMFDLSASAIKMRLKRSRQKLNQLYEVATQTSLNNALAQL